MDKIKRLREERAEKETKFEALTKAAEGRSLTNDETAQLDTIEKEINAIEAELKSLEAIEKRTAEIAKRKIEAGSVGAVQDNHSERKELSKYSYSKAFTDVHNHRQGKLGELKGFEAEMSQEAHKEAAESGITLMGNICLPSRMIEFASKQDTRLLTVATEGTDVVRTDFGGLINSLRIEPIVDRLGVTILSGLRGNLKYPRSNNDLTLVWETEVSDADEVTPTFDAVDLSPKRLSGYLDVSIQMMRQSNFVLEPFIRGKLQYGIEAAYDTALLVGPSGGNSPVGIANYSGVTVIPIGTNGGALTYALLVSTLTEAQIDNVRDGNSGYVINPQTFGKLAATSRQASGVEGNFIINPDNRSLFGDKVIVTNRMRSTLTKGSGTALSEMIYSPRWASAILATWGGADILFDPYTQATKGTVRFVVNAYADVDVEHPEEFVVIKDIVTT